MLVFLNYAKNYASTIYQSLTSYPLARDVEMSLLTWKIGKVLVTCFARSTKFTLFFQTWRLVRAQNWHMVITFFRSEI